MTRSKKERYGITRKQSHEWQKLAAMSKDEFEAMLKLPPRERTSVYNAVKRGRVGGHGRTARPGALLLRDLRAIAQHLATPLALLSSDPDDDERGEAIGLVDAFCTWLADND